MPLVYKIFKKGIKKSMEGSVISSVESVLTFLGSIFTAVMGWFGEVFNVIVENPLLLVIVAIPIVYTVVRISIGIIHRFGVHS